MTHAALGPAAAVVLEGTEIRLFDPARRPQSWSDLIGPTQCAVFLRDLETSVPYSAAGTPCLAVTACSCVIFNSIDAAQQFCEERVRAMPNLCGEIFDAAGRTHPPLLVITHPDRSCELESSDASSRRRRIGAVILFLLAGPLVWLDWERDYGMVLPTFLAFTCVIAGLRFLYWDYGVTYQERNRRDRLEAHRRRERDA